MLEKPLDLIEEADLHQLLANAVVESRTIEYKRDLPGGADKDKKEFLADVSSFANTTGGDLIFGVEEKLGVPSAVGGVPCGDADSEIGRLENIIRDGLEPRITCAIRAIPLAGGNKVFVLRIRPSWTGPHRVTFGGHDKFYGRHSTGKYQMDVAELRAAFLQSEVATKKMRNLRTERIADIASGNTPVPLNRDGAIILHVMPLASFTSGEQVDFARYKRDSTNMRPIGAGGWGTRINLDGIVSYSGGEEGTRSYTQLYRNGVIEAVSGHLYAVMGGRHVIPSTYFENTVLEFLPVAQKILSEMGMNPPYFVGLTLLGAKGCILGINGAMMFPEDQNAIEQDTLVLPEAASDHLGETPSKTMRPIFDMVWNACGFERSMNYDGDGNWKSG